MFRVGLVLLKQMLGSVDKLRELQGMYETMERLRNIPPESIREDLLVHEVRALGSCFTHKHTHTPRLVFPKQQACSYSPTPARASQPACVCVCVMSGSILITSCGRFLCFRRSSPWR